MLEVNQLWYFVEEDNAQDQQAYPSCGSCCLRIASLHETLLVCLACPTI